MHVIVGALMNNSCFLQGNIQMAAYTVKDLLTLDILGIL